MPVIVLLLVLVVSGHLCGADLPNAVHRGDAVRIRSLLTGQLDLQARDSNGNTALHWAALNGDALLVKELLEHGASPNATNSVGATPLLYAVGDVKSVRALLEAGAGN